MATAAEIIAALSTVAPDTEMTLPSTCPTPPSSPPSPPDNNGPLSWVPKEWQKDQQILAITNSFYVEHAGVFDHTDPRRINFTLRDLLNKLQAKVAFYLVCKYGDVAYQRMPYQIRSMLQGQDMSTIGWSAV